MINFEAFKPSGDVPIYLEIISYIKRGIISGTIVNGDTMPSRRVVSSRLGINPNTVQKSYRLLEDEGIIVSKSGAKSTITVDDVKIKAIKREMLDRELLETVERLKQMGLTKVESLSLLAEKWEE